jgi:hypothetical protein
VRYLITRRQVLKPLTKEMHRNYCEISRDRLTCKEDGDFRIESKFHSIPVSHRADMELELPDSE